MKLSSFFLYLAMIVTGVWYMGTGCANVGSPTGGDRDTIPPRLVNITPAQNTLNYKDGVLRLQFDELVTLKNLQQQLIITPRTEAKYKARVNKNIVELSFEEPLNDSTTYTFNFREGIVDITEGNIAPNLYLAFSTGNYLDSLIIRGKVRDALTDKVVEGATVVLFDPRDTTTVFTDKPAYFSTTDKEGNYELRNLKKGPYLVYGFTDNNKNLTLQTKNERYGYWPDTLQLAATTDSVNMRLFSVTADKPVVNSARPVGNYFEVTFNKPMNSYELQTEGTTEVSSNFIEKNKKVRIYPQAIQDSLWATITALDSLQQVASDTFYIRFDESKRAKASFTVDPLPRKGSSITKNLQLNLQFSKPVAELRTDSLRVMYDSLTWETIIAEEIEWNNKRDRLTIRKTLSPPQQAQTATTTETDPQKLARGGAGKKEQQVEVRVPKGSVYSVESDTLDNQALNYRFATESQTGIINGTIATAAENYIVQLLRANNFEVVSQQTNTRQYTFRFVEPGDYLIRVVVDQNANGRWDPGNIFKLEAPEPVFINEQPITIKANWEIQNPEITL
ncbi:Ig-like domain-containing protein [Cesiribacter sp. SM1]|uniref:Ig-like domain-containing protein n=1 Tax=Cesiribacter sp. SM1 TaxID=2861196 RepID=UPI001CD65A65|nr:Ig-like domain-containing protein [Cesiribacter sp. SM1]